MANLGGKMTRYAVLAMLGLLLAAGAAPAHAIMIQSHEIPLVIDTWGRFKQNQSVFMWTPFDSLREHWDLTGYQSGNFARVGLRAASQGRPPAPDSMAVDPPSPDICEMDTLGSGTEQWVFLYKNSLGLWIDGIDLTIDVYRFIGNYRPDQQVYNTPVYRGGSWMTAISWTYEIIPGFPYTASEQHVKRVVAKGKVKVTLSGEYYWPCLVVRDYMVYTDNLNTNDRRWIYEWLVPGHFLGANGVAAAMSQNGASENFINVEQFFQMERCSIPGWDVIPPAFADPVVLGDTSDAGPFVVSTRVIDNVAVGLDSLCYRVDEGEWQAVGSDSAVSGRYFYTIPAVAGPARIDYYYWAMDAFSAAESMEFWTTWPVCSPESTMVSFNVTSVGTSEAGRAAAGFAVRVAPNPSAGRTRFAVSLPGAGPAELRLYSTAGRLVRSFTLYPDRRGGCEVAWDGTDFKGRRLPAGTYAWRLEGGWDEATGKLVLER
ncbi:MAG: FlgD immunoglobulin-like domain containing protein [bacterium]